MKRLLIIMLLLTGCDRLQRYVTPEAPPTPKTVDVICDFGGGSGCTEQSLRSILTEVATDLPAGSVVRLHGMADDVARATELATFTATKSAKKTVRAVAGHERRQTEALIGEFATAATPVWEHMDRRRSPIASTIARALLSGNPNSGTRHVYVLTDAREVSNTPSLGKLDFECGTILDGDAYAKRLRKLLPEHSAQGVFLHFRHVKLEPVANNRCPATVERYAALQETTTSAWSQVGALVTWSMN